MPISRLDHPVYDLTCHQCEDTAKHEDGMTFHFESTDGASAWAEDNGWTVPSHPDFHFLCPDCTQTTADEQADAEVSR